MTVFFGNRQQSNARAGQKKIHVFFGNAQPKFNARAHLKQRKKIALRLTRKALDMFTKLISFNLNGFISSKQ